MQDLNIALVQSALVWENPEQNRTNFDRKLEEIDTEVDLIILPEMFNTGFSINPGKNAEPEEGPTFEWMQLKARENNCTITGSILTESDGKYFNRLYWVYPDGSFLTYDKRHLFRLSTEWKVFSQGTTKQIVELNGWKILPLVCYDLRFPVWSKNSYINGEYGYDALIYVANWPVARKYAWKHLLIARAIENQAYVAGVNRVGQDGNGIHHSGNSMALDAKGQIIAQADPHIEEIVFTQFSYEELTAFREQFTIGPDWDGFDIRI